MSDSNGNFDREDVLSRFQNRRDLLQELIELFIENGPPLIQQVRASIEAGDAKELEYAAHSIKGMVATFGASGCAASGLVLEKMGRSGDLSQVQPALADLNQHYQRVFDVLQAVFAEGK